MRTPIFSLFSCGLFVTLAFAAGDSEAGGKKAKSKFQSPYSQLILELRAAKHWLNEANHDYQGHRAKAVTEVSHAIHQLEEHPHHKPHHKEIHNHKPAIHEPQKISDAQMVLAHQIVLDVAKKLATISTDDKHLTRAGLHLQEADKQIGLGLAHVKNKK
jgi:hypothetical protein